MNITDPVFFLMMGVLFGICIKNSIEIAEMRPKLHEIWKILMRKKKRM